MEATQSIKHDVGADFYKISTTNGKKQKEHDSQLINIPEKKAANDSSKRIMDENLIDEVATGLNNFLESIQTDLRVEIHSKTKTAVFKIIKRDNSEVIKEIPPKELLDLAVKIEEMLGSLIDTNV